mgnify:CR=1 FL=1
MAFSAASLTRLAGGSGVGLWHYTSADAIGDINTAGYFNDASDMLNVYDYMIIVSSTGGTVAVSHAYVASNASGVVDIIDGVAITSTDSD